MPILEKFVQYALVSESSDVEHISNIAGNDHQVVGFYPENDGASDSNDEDRNGDSGNIGPRERMLAAEQEIARRLGQVNGDINILGSHCQDDIDGSIDSSSYAHGGVDDDQEDGEQEADQ